MIPLNQTAPPAEAPKSGDVVKLPPFPKSDSFVATIVAYNFIAEYEFERKDDKTGEEYIKIAPAVELYFGAMVDGKPYFAKTWPQQYSLSDRANFRKWYEAITGKAPAAGSNVADLLGKYALVEIKVEDKKSKKGTVYTVSTPKTIGKVPSILAATGTPIEQLKPALDAALAASGEKKEGNPF